MNHKSVFRSLVARRFTAAGVCAVLTAGVLTASWLQHADTPPAAAAESSSDGVADTEAEARAEAAASGQTVEVLSARSERRDVMANPDGTFTATEYTQPVRTLKNGTWVAVDPTLQVLSDGRVAPVASTVDVVFSGGGTGPLIQVDKAGRSVSFGWDGPLPVPTLDGASATYAEVFPGVDLVVKAAGAGFSHTLVVKTAAAAANPELARIDMPITVDGAAVRATDAGGVEIVDAATGGVMMEADAPSMWDSGAAPSGVSALAAGEETVGDRAEIGVAVDTDTLTLVPDQNLLTGADTSYPVYIDPIWGDRYRTSYTMVDSGYPSEEYWKFDGEPDEGLGLCPVSSGTCNNSKIKRLFYQFGSLPYSGKTIITAEFAVTLRYNWKGANTSDYADLYKASKTITSSTNWGNQPSGSKIAEANTPAPSGGSCALSTDHGTEFNIKSTLQSVANAGTTTLTLGLRNASESDSTKWMRFCPNGHLRVRYNSPPDQPQMSGMTTSPGKNCAVAPSEPALTNKLPKLKVTVTDPDSNMDADIASAIPGEQMKAEFMLVWGAGDANVWQPLDSAGKPVLFGTPTLDAAHPSATIEINLANYATQLDTTLPKNTTIGWIARAFDGYSYSPWSWAGAPIRCSFYWDTTLPDAPEITSSTFATDGVWNDMVGEYGDLTFSSTSLDATAFTYQVSDGSGSTNPVVASLNADGTAKVATISWIPKAAGAYVFTVWVRDAAGNTGASSNTYSFNVATPTTPGDWSLSEAAGSSTAASAGLVNGTDPNPAAAGPGVTFGAPGPASNGSPNPTIPTAAHFDGSAGAYLSTTKRELAPTIEGFAVSAWVNTDDLTRNQTAVSIDGGGEAGFTLGYDAATASWSFSIPDYDIQAFAPFKATTSGVEAGEWAHLIGVYDAMDRSMRLYVNGVAPEATPVTTDIATRGTWWNATGPVQIGRHYSGYGYTDNWNGDIAEVKIFNRIVAADEIAALSTLTPIRQGYWQFNDDVVNGISPEYTGNTALGLALAGGASIYAPTPDDIVLGASPALVGVGHLVLDGTDDAAATTNPVLNDTTGSFTLTAQVQPASLEAGTAQTVLSIPGTNTNLVTLRLSATGSWEVEVAHEDTVGAATTIVSNPLVESGQQLLAVVYDAFTDRLSLYVNGLASSVQTVAFQGLPATTTGTLQVGRDQLAGTGSNFFSGAIDDIRVYQGVTSATTLQRISDPTAEQPGL